VKEKKLLVTRPTTGETMKNRLDKEAKSLQGYDFLNVL
jgi:hypothetical protein